MPLYGNLAKFPLALHNNLSKTQTTRSSPDIINSNAVAEKDNLCDNQELVLVIISFILVTVKCDFWLIL